MSRTLPPKTVIGTRHGDITILDSGPLRKTGSRKRFVMVRCDCGKEWLADEYSVLIGTTKRCLKCARIHTGQTQRTDPTSEDSWNTWLYRYRYNASTRDLPWGLSKTEFVNICQTCCYYCNTPPISRKVGRHSIETNGIDRMDNSDGYVIGNVVSCCSICNRMKGTMNKDEFLLHLEKIFWGRM